jgi:hypothetical protein
LTTASGFGFGFDLNFDYGSVLTTALASTLMTALAPTTNDNIIFGIGINIAIQHHWQ